MTDGSVAISITIKVEDVVMEFQEKVPIDAVEESVNSLSTGLGQQVLHGVIRVLDDRIARNVPADWQNVGTEMRWMAIEIAWAWLRYQPDSTLSCWYNRRFAEGRCRVRRIGIVALARKLLIELWKYLETGVVPEGAYLKSS